MYFLRNTQNLWKLPKACMYDSKIDINLLAKFCTFLSISGQLNCLRKVLLKLILMRQFFLSVLQIGRKLDNQRERFDASYPR